MKYLDKSFTVGQPKHADMACERCVYGTGEHAEWCKEGVRERVRRFGYKDRPRAKQESSLNRETLI